MNSSRQPDEIKKYLSKFCAWTIGIWDVNDEVATKMHELVCESMKEHMVSISGFEMMMKNQVTEIP